MYHNSNAGSLSILMLFILILISISNYLSFNKIEQKLEPKLAPEPAFDPIALYDSLPSKELRKNALKSAENNRKELLIASKQDQHKTFYNAVKMEAYCAVKERIGGNGDGGKLVCNPKLVKEDCTLLSLGLHNQIGYDGHIYNVTGKQCKILGADKDPQNPKTQTSYEKMNGQIFVGKIPDELTLPSMLQQSGRNEVELLKIDIEGGEFTGLEPLISEHFVCQIFIEVHGTPAEHLSMLRMMSKYGFRLFSLEENPYCVRCCEYSLINELCMAQFGVVPLGNVIPEINK
ncbi:Methyltransferase FkbM domain-containing protein [Caenorhabditis elegans]|uniref:Methyltransferase FkbM domain-containing protein n=1 Tax=Caenorhabditis elegans TaxID=6239 RepID=O17108_CAEEL|nr:Methyltransferase FkbM domain-containing protein [Caenorhabditis elegans]CCD64473.1 Methyltransferase FkbM domain-containing protein [Caenorhabditis elegans]|eukprot:NP_503254.1 Uncharacterized protein CELE_K06H6.2 [Caenorhabditis elegans]